MDIEIKPLSKELKEDYLFFFDNIVFEENLDRHKCYCIDFNFLGDVETCTRKMSRSMIIDRIDNNKHKGYLAYENEKVVGWCNVNERLNYERLIRDFDVIDNLDDKACSIVCFLIHPNYRRKGISNQILKRIIEDYSNTNFDYLEAYPKKGDLSNEGNFKGPKELYKRFGFEVHKEHDEYYVMRKAIN